jgi:LmbE family N-acetylglucosaminyl deacetylase
MNILAIGAHPDDVEFMCAGTLAKLKKKGHLIFIATVANGSCGSMEYRAKDIIRIRREEAKQGAKLLEAPYYCADIDDLMVDNVASIRKKVVEILRKVNPDIVFTHSVEDYMIDHVSTSTLVKDACFCAPMPNYAAKGKPFARIPYLYYGLPLEGKDMYGNKIKPRLLIDITDQMPLKTKMLACHKSQRDWLRRQHGMDQYIETMKDWARQLGRLLGCPYAEGFRQHLGHGFPHDNILKSIV